MLPRSCRDWGLSAAVRYHEECIVGPDKPFVERVRQPEAFNGPPVSDYVVKVVLAEQPGKDFSANPELWAFNQTLINRNLRLRSCGSGEKAHPSEQSPAKNIRPVIFPLHELVHGHVQTG